MPSFIAKKLCPELILLEVDLPKYMKTSKIFLEVLKQYDNCLESMGSDEANLDITDYLQQNNIKTEEEILNFCNSIRCKIFEKTGGLTASCGIACNKTLAKMGSEVNKPNGQFLLKSNKEDILNFLKEKNVRKIPG